MAGRLILAVAGSGKTSYLLEQLDEQRRSLVIGYTNNNIDSIKSRIVERFGHHPKNITVLSYFSFLYSFCYKPFCHMRLGTTGINFEPNRNRFAKGLARYIDSSGRVYSNRLAKFIKEQSLEVLVRERLGKYFDQVLIDEFQDFGGHDFNFIPTIVGSGSDVLCVGDFFQHTFSTSMDGNVGKNLYSGQSGYLKACTGAGLEIDQETLNNSHRCSPAVCGFVSEKLGIAIGSNRSDQTSVSFVEGKEEVVDLLADDSIIKLFYQNSRRYECWSSNWGESKGIDHYNSVCVVLNPTTLKAFKNDSLRELKPSTKNKLYVACTRARGDLYFVPQSLLK